MQERNWVKAVQLSVHSILFKKTQIKQSVH